MNRKNSAIILFIIFIIFTQKSFSQEFETSNSLDFDPESESDSYGYYYSPRIAFESFIPTDDSHYQYEGINMIIQIERDTESYPFNIIMEPSISFLEDKYLGNERKIFFAKWNQGFGYKYEISEKSTLQPNALLGVGFSSIDASKDENSALFEISLGIDYNYNEKISVFLKSGYRLLNFDDYGDQSIGNLKGSYATLGAGISI